MNDLYMDAHLIWPQVTARPDSNMEVESSGIPEYLEKAFNPKRPEDIFPGSDLDPFLSEVEKKREEHLEGIGKAMKEINKEHEKELVDKLLSTVRRSAEMPKADYFHYEYDHYIKDVRTIARELEPFKDNLNIVGIYKGSLPLATHLANLLNRPMSILKYQSRDDHAEFQGKCEWVVNTIKPGQRLVIVEDIYDSGETFNKIFQFLKTEHLNKRIDISDRLCYTLYTSKKVPGIRFLNESLGRWIVFPWEKL